MIVLFLLRQELIQALVLLTLEASNFLPEFSIFCVKFLDLGSVIVMGFLGLLEALL